MTETAFPTHQDPNDILMGGGDGVPAAKFPDPGTFVEGVVKSPPRAYQETEWDPKTNQRGAGRVFPSGDPIMGVTVDLATGERDPMIEGDDGTRRVYIEGRKLKGTIRDAIAAAGGKGLEVGAFLRVDFTHRDDPMDKRSAKNYTAVYRTAANQQMMGGQPVAAPATVPAQYQPATSAHQTVQTPQVQPAPVQATLPVQEPAPAAAPVPQAAPAPVAAAPANDPVALARQLIAAGVPDAAIQGATQLDLAVIAAIRAAG